MNKKIILYILLMLFCSESYGDIINDPMYQLYIDDDVAAEDKLIIVEKMAACSVISKLMVAGSERSGNTKHINLYKETAKESRIVGRVIASSLGYQEKYYDAQYKQYKSLITTQFSIIESKEEVNDFFSKWTQKCAETGILRGAIIEKLYREIYKK